MEHWVDIIIFVAFLLVSIGIGVYHAFTGGKQKTTEEFILADRKLKVLPTAVSLVVSYMSALTIIGAPSELYAYGIIFWPGSTIMGPLIGAIFVSEVIIPWMYPLRLTSVYDYFSKRYGTNVIQKFTSFLGIFNAILYTGIATLAPAIAMETATGFPASFSIPIITIVGVIYTALGGMRAVIWTDVFQSVIMVGGVIVIMIKAFINVGGIGESFALLHQENRTIFSISPDPTERHTVWGFIFGLSIGNVGFLGLAQSSIQRFAAVPTLRQAKKIPYIWLIGMSFLAGLCSLSGVAMFSYYAKHNCDPILSGQVKSSNQIFPLFVMDMLHGIPGFSGLFLATLYSATLSTVSSTLSGAAANAWDDHIKPNYPEIPQSRATLINKLTIVVFGLLSIGLAFVAANVPGPLLQITISLMTSVGGPLVGLFFLAGLPCFKCVNWQGALAGGIMGLGITTWIVVGSIFVKGCHPYLPPLPVDGCQNMLNTTINFDDFVIPRNITVVTGFNRIYCLSYLWNTLLGIVSVIVSALVATVFLKCCLRKRYQLIQPVSDEVFIRCFCSKSIKRKQYDKNAYLKSKEEIEAITSSI